VGEIGEDAPMKDRHICPMIMECVLGEWLLAGSGVVLRDWVSYRG
jgi:hypothetical protein